MNQKRRRVQDDGDAENNGSPFDPGPRLATRPVARTVPSYNPSRVRLQIIVGSAAIVVSLVALVWWLSLKPKPHRIVLESSSIQNPASVPSVADPTLALPSPQPNVDPVVTQPQSAPPPWSDPQPAPSTVLPSNGAPLLIPVAGVQPQQLRDTFQDSRSEGRSHDAIDIPAPRGTPVLAAADGRIIKLSQHALGGTTIYQLGTGNRSVYYYAHLDRYADGLVEGHIARRGDVIAYVGDTGNAGAGNYHLHFSILIVSDPKRYWDGTNINPYPLLRGTQ